MCVCVCVCGPNMSQGIDAASVASSGTSKVKINVTKTYTSGEYLIWNSLGKSRRCIPPAQPLSIVDN